MSAAAIAFDSRDLNRWLEEGIPVESRVFGRVGRVLSVGDGGVVRIRGPLGDCVTRFDRGDVVVAERHAGGVTLHNRSCP